MSQTPDQNRNQEVWLRNSLNKNNRLEFEIKSLQNEVKTKNQQLSQLELDYKGQVNQLQQQIQTNQSLQLQIQQISQVNLDQKRTIEQLTDQNNQLRNQLKQVQETNNIEKNQSKQLLERANTDIQKLKNEILQLQRNNDSLQQQKTYQISQLDTNSKKIIEELQEQIHKMQLSATSKIESLTSELSLKNDQLDKLTKEINIKKNEIYQSTVNYEAVNATKSQQLIQAQQIQQKLQQDYNDKLAQFQMQAQLKITQMEQEIVQKNTIIEKANQDLAKKAQEIKDNNQNFEQINIQNQKKLQEMMIQVQKLQLAIESENTQFDRKKGNLKVQIDNLEKDLTIQQQSSTQYTQNLNNEINQLKNQNLDLQKQLSEKHKTFCLTQTEQDAQIKQLNLQIVSFQKEIQLKNQQLQQAESQLLEMKVLKTQEVEQLKLKFDQREKELLIQNDQLSNNTKIQSQRVITLTNEELNKQVKQVDQFWTEKYNNLSKQTKEDIQQLSYQYQMQLAQMDQANKDKIKIVEQNQNKLLNSQKEIFNEQIILFNKQILDLQKEKENSIIQLDVIKFRLKEFQDKEQNLNNRDQRKDELIQNQMATLKNSKEELLNVINQQNLDHKKEIFNLQTKIDSVQQQYENSVRETKQIKEQLKLSQLEAQQVQNLSHQKNKESLNAHAEKESEIIKLQSELSRVESLYKQVVLELKIINEQKNDLQVIDDFQLKEKDIEIGNQKSCILELKQKLQQLQKRINELELQLQSANKKLTQKDQEAKKEIDNLNQRIIIQKRQIQEERERCDELAGAQDMEVQTWNERLKEQQKLNEDLITQLMRLQQQTSQNSGLINELHNMKQQFEVVTNQYQQLQEDAEEATKQKSMVKNVQIQMLQNHYNKQMDVLTKQLEEMKQQNLNQKLDFPIMDFNVQIIALNDLLVKKNAEINQLKSQTQYKLLEKDNVIDQQREYTQKLQNEFEKLQQQLMDQSEFQERADNLQMINEEKDNTLQFLKEEITKLKQENKLMKGKLDLKEQSMVVIQDQQQLIKQLKIELQNKQKNIQPKQIAISHLQTMKSSIHRMSKRSESSRQEKSEVDWNGESQFLLGNANNQLPCFHQQSQDSFTDNKLIEKMNSEIVDTNIKLRNQVDLLNQDKENLQINLSKTIQNLNQIKNENSELILKLQYVQKALESSQQNYEQLEREINQKKKKEISIVSFDDQMNSKVKALNQQLENLQSSKTQQIQLITHLQQEQSELYKQIDRINDQNRELRKNITVINELNKSQEQQIIELQMKLKQEQLVTVKQNSEVRVFQLKQDQTSQIVSYENQQLKQQNIELSNQLQEQNQLISNQENQLQKKNGIEKKYEEQQKQLRLYLDKIDNLENEKRQLEQEQNKIIMDSNKLLVRNEDYAIKVNQLEKTYQQLKQELQEQQVQHEKQQVFLEREKQQLQSQVKLLNISLQNLQRLNKSQGSEEDTNNNQLVVDKQINELNSKLQEKINQNKSLQQQTEQQNVEIRNLNLQIQSLQQMYQPVQNQMEELQILIEQQQKQIEKQSQQQTTFSSTQRINDLEKELLEKQNMIEEATYKKNFLEQQQQNNVREMNDLRQKITQYQLINEQLNEQIDQMINDQEQVKLEYEQKMIDYQNSVRRQIQTFHNNSVDLLDQVDQLNKQNQESKQQIIKLSQQLREREFEIQRQQQDFLQQQNYYQELQVTVVNENNQLKSQLHQMEIELQNVKFKDTQSVTNLTASQELKFKHLYEALQEKENKTNQMNKELQHQLVLYDKQAKTLQNRVSHLEDEIKQYQEKESINYESTVTFHQPEEIQQQLHEQNIKLTSQVQMFSSQHFQFEKQINEYDEKITYLQFKQEKEIKQLTEQHKQNNQQLNDQLQMSKKDLKDLQIKFDQLTQKYQDQIVQNDKLQKQNQQLSQQIFNQQKDINNYNQQANEKLEQANHLNQQLLKQISQLNNIRQQDQDEIRKLSTQIKYIQDEQGNYHNQIRLLQNQLNEKNEDSTSEKNEIVDLKKTITQLKNENERLKNDEYNPKFDQSNQLRQQIRQLTQQNEFQKQEIIILKQQITSEQNTNKNEIQNYKKQVDKLQNQLKQGRNDISNTPDKQMEQIIQLQANLQQLQKTLRESEEQNRNLLRQITLLQKDDYKQKQKQKKRVLKDKIIELQQELSNSQRDYSRSEKDKSNKMVKFYDKEIEEKQRLINSLEEQFKILQKGYEDQDLEIKQLEEENSKLKYQSDNYQNELAILRINQNLSLNPNITINNLNIQQENKILELKIQKLTTQLDELNLKLQDSENDLADMIENYKQEQYKNKQLESNLRNSKLTSKDIENQYRQMILKELPIYADKTLEQIINLLILNGIPNKSSQINQQFIELQKQNQEMLEEIQILVEKIKSQEIEYNDLQEQLQQTAKQNSVYGVNHIQGMSSNFEKDKKIIELENKLVLLASENSRLNHIKNQQHKKLQSQQITQQDIQNY